MTISRFSKLASLVLLSTSISAFAGVGSSNTATADPPVPHPHTRPCKVVLFQHYRFDDFNPRAFTYAPPAACPAPWAKVILVGDFSVTAGRQFDRTANIWLGPTNIYFGTTSEPSHDTGRHWQIQRDLTDYSSIFTAPQDGAADIGNLVDQTYTGIIYGTVTMEFYPPSPKAPAPVPADQVIAFSGGPTGGTVALDTTGQCCQPSLSQTLTLPMNIQRAYLDVFAQSQNDDEFWYTCVPNDVSGELESCPNTAFRESEIAIDGAPAGVAPVYPWIYTGGIDPYLWFPIPGVQTLNFVPYRVDLTPFAALLDDGNPHTISMSVYNAADYFSATASLLLYLDHGSTQVTGAITQKIGRLELANRGSLFLDEIGDIPLEGQPKLLRVLQEREFERLGSTNTKKVDVRIVAATHRALEEMIVEKQFRLDLYYRLNVFPISIPPLRERPEDIPLLVRHFVQQFAQRMNKTIVAISSETMEALARYRWPGNIRELQNVIERSVVVYEKGNLSIKKSWLSGESFQFEPPAQAPFRRFSMEERERVGAALAETRGRVSGPAGAAAKLGIPPSTLESKIRSMNIDKYRFKTSNSRTLRSRIQYRFSRTSRIREETAAL